jgi:hypothetical protein
VRRLVQRVGLGPRPGELDVAASRGFDASVAALTQPATSSDAGVAATPVPDFGAPAPRLTKTASIEALPAPAERAIQQRLLSRWIRPMAI